MMVTGAFSSPRTMSPSGPGFISSAGEGSCACAGPMKSKPEKPALMAAMPVRASAQVPMANSRRVIFKEDSLCSRRVAPPTSLQLHEAETPQMPARPDILTWQMWQPQAAVPSPLHLVTVV